MKPPTLREKIIQYETFLHKINSFLICGNNEGIKELIQNADNWSYAHRCGNGEISDRQQDRLIINAFWKLLDTPCADKLTKDRQAAWAESQKQKHEAFTVNR